MIQFVTRYRHPLILGIIVFFVTFVYYCQVHPVYPYDADDWTYLHNWRDIYPSTQKYNPTRILPEILMPLCGEISMVLVYPFVHDITISVCITSSFILASVITLYLLLFYNLLRKKYSIKPLDTMIMSLLFLAFHFFFFLKNDWENDHLLHSFDLCCHFNYTIPNVLASCFVLYFIAKRDKDLSIEGTGVKQGLLFLCIYLVILSHVFSSIILIVYWGVDLLFSLFSIIKHRENISSVAKKKVLPISGIILWLIILVFESSGSRANAVQTIDTTPFSVSLSIAAKNLATMFLYRTNLFADSLLLLCYLCFLFISIKEKRVTWQAKLAVILIVSFFITCFYLILMGAVSYPYYLLRLMTIFGAPFFLMLGGFVCLASIIQKIKVISITLPILLLLLFSKMQRDGGTFQDVQTLYIKQEIQGTYKVSPQDILKQNQKNIQYLISADQKGIKDPNIFVPRFNHYENWPLANYYGLRLARFLYKYGLISAPLKATITPYDNSNTSDNDGE